jgi:hypothetical protein
MQGWYFNFDFLPLTFKIVDNHFSCSEAKQLFGTTTVTVTSAVTITSSTKTSVTCAKLVNVTGACRRRRRGMLKEKPVIISSMTILTGLSKFYLLQELSK